MLYANWRKTAKLLLAVIIALQVFAGPLTAYGKQEKENGLYTQIYKTKGMTDEWNFLTGRNPNNLDTAFGFGTNGTTYVQDGFSRVTGDPKRTLFFGTDYDYEWAIPVDTQAKEVSGFIKVPADGDYYFGIQSDDGCLGILNGIVFAEHYNATAKNFVTNHVKFTLKADTYYPITIRYFNQPSHDLDLLEFFQRGEFQLVYKVGSDFEEDIWVNDCFIFGHWENRDYRTLWDGRKVLHEAAKFRFPNEWLFPSSPSSPIDVQLSHSPSDYTNGNVTIYVQITGSSTEEFTIKWAKGEHDAPYFRGNGSGNGKKWAEINCTSFEVSENGIYSVYVTWDKKEEIIKYITISNIDKTAPVIVLSYDPKFSTTDAVTITASVSDGENGSGIAEKKWAKGVKSVSDFSSEGKLFTNSTFLVYENGSYTVYARDNAGNEAVSVIEISNITRKLPEIVLSQAPIYEGEELVAVRIDVAVTGSTVPVEVLKWTLGEESHEYFREEGNGTVINDYFFTVTDNGTYVVYLRDVAGYETTAAIGIVAFTSKLPDLL